MRRSFLLACAGIAASVVLACGGGTAASEPTAIPQATAQSTAVPTKPSQSGQTPVSAEVTPSATASSASPTASVAASASATSTSAPNTQVVATQPPAVTQAPATQPPPPTATPPKASGNPLSANVGVTGTARYFWTPNSLKIAPGGSVTFSWSDGAAHDLSVPGLGFEGAAKVTASYTVSFPSAGEYEMICIIHTATMKGKIIVE